MTAAASTCATQFSRIHSRQSMRPSSVPGLAETLSELLGEDAELVAAGNVVAMSMEGWAQHVDTGENEVLADNLGAQAWHADGPHLFTTLPDTTLPAHAINIFVPLVDLTEENGPTEFAIGSHKLGHEYNEEEEEVDGTSRVTSILAKAGDAILFDYRLWHRGLPNSSDTDRPMLYLVAARSFWRDDRNYSQGSSLFEQAASASSSTAAASSAQPPAGERVPLLKRRPGWCSSRRLRRRRAARSRSAAGSGEGQVKRECFDQQNALSPVSTTAGRRICRPSAS